jgi:Zn-dependent protease/predicted transcriptional regulator
MKGVLKLGRIAGIQILVHWTFLLLIGWIVFREMQRGSDTVTTLITIGFVMALFLCVVLHELGHSLTARRFGIETRKITLLPIGGVASLERIPEDPKQELLVAVAGPAVNVVIALILYIFTPVRQINPEDLMEGITTWQGFLFSLFTVNIFLVIFNAIPAFPMDGGRILRSLLAMRLGRLRATQLAASLGQFIAILFVFVGLFYNPFLVLIGIFVSFGARSENIMVQHSELLRDHLVHEAMMTNYITLNPDDSIMTAAEKLLAGSDQDLLVVDGDVPIGIMTKASIFEAMKNDQRETPVRQFMDTNMQILHPNSRLNKVYTEAIQKRKSIYPVVQNDRLIGIVDMNNIQEFMMIQSALRGQ